MFRELTSDEVRDIYNRYMKQDFPPQAVSYTHLDVYKRQSLQLGMWIFYFVPVGIFALTCLYAFGKIGSEIKMMGEGEK